MQWWLTSQHTMLTLTCLRLLTSARTSLSLTRLSSRWGCRLHADRDPQYVRQEYGACKVPELACFACCCFLRVCHADQRHERILTYGCPTSEPASETSSQRLNQHGLKCCRQKIQCTGSTKRQAASLQAVSMPRPDCMLYYPSVHLPISSTGEEMPLAGE